MSIKNMKVVYLLVLVLIIVQVSLSGALWLHQSRNTRLSGSAFLTATVKNKLQCSFVCLRNPQCVAMNDHRINENELHCSLFEEPEYLTQATEFASDTSFWLDADLVSNCNIEIHSYGASDPDFALSGERAWIIINGV